MNRDMTAKIAEVTRSYTKEKEYWHRQLAGEIQRSGFPPDQKIDSALNGNAEGTPQIKEIRVEGEIYNRLLALSTNNNPTLHVILTTVMVVLLGKYTGNPDIVLGVPVYKQEQEANFINTILALRNRIDLGITFKGLLLRVKDTLLEALDHQNYPFEKLLNELYPETAGNSEENPLFDVVLLLDNIHDHTYIRHISRKMTVIFSNQETYLSGRVEYDTRYYTGQTIDQIIDHLLIVINTVLREIDIPVARIEIMTPEEKFKLLEEFNQTATPGNSGLCMHQLFEQQVEKTPNAIAVIENEIKPEKDGVSEDQPAESGPGQTITFQQLNQEAESYSHYLSQQGVGPETIAGIQMERSINLVIGILGILKAGGAYMPIETHLPEERINYMMTDSNAEHLVTTGLFSTRPTSVTPPREKVRVTERSAAYVIYTSGTTGKPKGVILEHRGVVNYLTWATQMYIDQNEMVMPVYTSIAFDFTITSLFLPLVTGNTVAMYNGDQKNLLLDKIILGNAVDLVKLTPAHLRIIKGMKETVDFSKSRIKRLILGGENLETSLAREIVDLWNGQVEIYNEYGPTETVVGSMIHCYHPSVDHLDSVSLGKPIANTQIYILDRDGNPVPQGVAGEIYIGGRGVGRGYLNRPELTAEKFVQPRQLNLPQVSDTLYKTGDLARFHKDGAVEFLGRSDHQVKIRGNRVELGEIENRLKQYKKKQQTPSILEQPITDTNKIRDIHRCNHCLLSDNYMGIRFDNHGVCNVCREFEGYEDHVKNYFKTPHDLDQLLKHQTKTNENYDCLLLFSGGKDSTYVLYRLIDMGLKVLTFTFDNGYISEAAFENIRRTTSALKVDHITGTAEQMNRVFVESLATNSSVCHGCWNAVNAYGAKLAHEKGINLVVSGLSRGQIFEMRLHGLFQAGIFEEQEIEEKLLYFRKGFHSNENKFARILDMVLQENVVEELRFVDFFRYDETRVKEILEYLYANGWEQPQDTGFCSSNCLINDVGIYMHYKTQGIHFYEAPLSWDVRLGQITRETGINELAFIPEPVHVDQILREIGYYTPASIADAVVLERADTNGNNYLCAYLVAEGEVTSKEIRDYLAAELPEYMIPSHFVQVNRIPLSPGGKVDRKALISLEENRPMGSSAPYVPPEEEKEILMATLLKQLLNLEQVGINDNFFELGATSFEIIQLNHQLAAEIKRDIPVIKFFEYPTITALLGYLEGEETSKKEEMIEIKRDEAMERGKTRFDMRRKMRK